MQFQAVLREKLNVLELALCTYYINLCIPGPNPKIFNGTKANSAKNVLFFV